MPKIENLPDEHSSKLECPFQLSRLINWVRNQAEYKQLLGNDRRVTQMSRLSSDANRLTVSLNEEGIQRAKEAPEIYQRSGDSSAAEHGQCPIKLALLLRGNDQLDAAQGDAFRAIGLTSERRSIPGLEISLHSWLHIPIQAQDGGGHSPLQSSSQYHAPPSTGTIRYFGFTTIWWSCSGMEVRGCTDSYRVCQVPRGQRCVLPGPCDRVASKISSTKRSPRFCGPPTFTKSLGLQMI